MWGSHNHGHIVCSVSIDTTGADPRNHDMTEICVMPLDRTYERDRNNRLFTTSIRPINDFPKSLPYHGKAAYKQTYVVRAGIGEYTKAISNGLGYGESADAFEAWFGKLNIQPGRRIMPLVYDWAFVSRFLIKWLGMEDFERMFHYQCRDLLGLAVAENDNFEYNHKEIPFVKVDYSYLSSKLGMPDACLQLPTTERALMLGQTYMSYHLKRNCWR